MSPRKAVKIDLKLYNALFDFIIIYNVLKQKSTNL